MKRLTLVKTSKSIQLGHLYEHIYYARIVAHFRKNHLYQHLDYSVEGETYDNGILYIGLELYTQEAMAFAEIVFRLDVDFSKDVVSIAATQILAEKEQPLDSSGVEDVLHGLKELQSQPWQNIEDIYTLDTKAIRKTARPFYIVEGDSLPARKLIVKLTVKPKFILSNRNLLPLFREVAGLIHANLRDNLADQYGYYAPKSSTATKNELSTRMVYKVAHDNDDHIEECLDTVLKVVNEMYSHQGFSRYMTELDKASFFDRLSSESAYKDVSIIIGPAGWQDITTRQNCELLLQNMIVELRVGRQQLSSVLWSVSY
jgi:hypothetical protein